MEVVLSLSRLHLCSLLWCSPILLFSLPLINLSLLSSALSRNKQPQGNPLKGTLPTKNKAKLRLPNSRRSNLFFFGSNFEKQDQRRLQTLPIMELATGLCCGMLVLLLLGQCGAKIWEIPLQKSVQDCYNQVEHADIRTYVGSEYSWLCDSTVRMSQAKKLPQFDAQKTRSVLSTWSSICQEWGYNLLQKRLKYFDISHQNSDLISLLLFPFTMLTFQNKKHEFTSGSAEQPMVSELHRPGGLPRFFSLANRHGL